MYARSFPGDHYDNFGDWMCSYNYRFSPRILPSKEPKLFVKIVVNTFIGQKTETDTIIALMSLEIRFPQILILSFIMHVKQHTLSSILVIPECTTQHTPIYIPAKWFLYFPYDIISNSKIAAGCAENNIFVDQEATEGQSGLNKDDTTAPEILLIK